MEAAVRELKQQAQDAAASAAKDKKEQEAAAEEITKLETLSAELKAQLEKAGDAHQQVSVHLLRQPPRLVAHSALGRLETLKLMVLQGGPCLLPVCRRYFDLCAADGSTGM